MNEPAERVIKVADIEPRLRHTMIERLFECLQPGHSLQIVVDHDPQRLRFHLDFAFGARCKWSYLERGPEVWRVRLQYAGQDAQNQTRNVDAD